MKDFGKKTGLYPEPALMLGTYDSLGNPNLMMAAWGGIYDTGMIYVCLSTNHKTCKNFEKTGFVTIMPATVKNIDKLDYLGMASGNTENKIEKIGFHHKKAPHVNAPMFDELPLTIECRVAKWNDGILVLEVSHTLADDSILTDGNIDPVKLDPVVFDEFNATYRRMGEVVGKAFSDGKKFF